MEWDNWKPWYARIKKDLKLKFNKDEKATKILNKLLEFEDIQSNLQEAISCVSEKVAFVYGCGPSLENNLKNLLNLDIFENEIKNIAADGAISALIKYKIFPHISVTDLDGNIKDLIVANQKGTISFIHAHGDNIPLLKKFVPKFKKIVGTTQTRPIGKVMNYGGFTDGDRAVFISEYLKASIIFLVGFDFGNIVGKFSKPTLKNDIPADEIKIKKLKLAKNLIKWVSSWSNAAIYNLTGSKDIIKGVKNVPYDELSGLLHKFFGN